MLYGFIAISIHDYAQNFIKLNSDRAKQFTFRRSADNYFSLPEIPEKSRKNGNLL